MAYLNDYHVIVTVICIYAIYVFLGESSKLQLLSLLLKSNIPSKLC